MSSDSAKVPFLAQDPESGEASYGSIQREEFRAVSFHDVEYTIPGSCRKKTKKILHGISGFLPQGLNAIMGPTGSGKTSLLDTLAGRKDTSGLSGNVLVNGDRQPKNFKCITGYVVQDDVVMGTLTVRENLHFSAALRLPSTFTKQQRDMRVKKVIKELGLRNCADTKIGTEFIRGVSGGEKKRTNIGMELIIEPQVLFLDEPTTGLDANTAVSVVEKLKVLSEERECTIIMSIHQPRYSIFKLFDTLTLLSQGSMVYHGPANQALEYFDRSLGFACEEHENPADFFLDVIIRCEKASNHFINSGSYGGKELEESAKSAVDIGASYQQSSQYQATEQKLSAIMDNLEARQTMRVSKPVSYATSFLWQLLIVSSRSFKNLVRTPTTFIVPMMMTIILALLVGVLYLRLDKKSFNAHTVINDRVGAMFFIVMSQVFINIPVISIFIQLRALFLHENVSGFYRVSTFFLAKIFAYMLPMRMVPLVFYVIITYFMVGFHLEASNFFIYYLTLGLTSITATSLAFAVSARIGIAAVALVIVAMCYILSVLFAGFLVSLNTLPVWLRWLKYVSFFRYALEALTINEIAGQCFFDATKFNATGNTCGDYRNATGSESCELPDCVNGTLDLVQRGYETDAHWLWYDQIGLAGLTIIFLVFAYINLRTIKKLK